MQNNVPLAVRHVNHIRYANGNNIPNMADTKKILWANVQTLMVRKYGKENLRQTAKDAGVGPGTMSRIKEQHTSTGFDTLEKLAVLFKVEPWQLILPGAGDQELMVFQDMHDMCPEQKSTFATISHSLAQQALADYGKKK